MSGGAAAQARRRPAVAAALALAALGLAGCATFGAPTPAPVGRGLPARAEVADVPFFAQERYQCGPAALAMALGWSGISVTPDQLVQQVYTPGREGTLRSDLLAAARRHGRLAVPVTSLDDLLAELAAGHPAIVFQNLGLWWYPVWHFAVAVGYDREAGDLVLRSGLDARRLTDLGTFERTWARGDRWAVVVLPPDRLPATAGERAVLTAAAGLERAGRPTEAAAAYGAALRRWPGSYAALVGLGNVRQALGDFGGAEAAFREATGVRPEAAAAWNNLAHALARQGRRAEAIAAAGEALRRATGTADVYRDTLREVSEGPVPEK